MAILQKMTTNGRNGQSADNFDGALGPPEPHALRAAMHIVARIASSASLIPWCIDGRTATIGHRYVPTRRGIEVLEGGLQR